jgi:excisionase family DNA binding protein
VVSIGEIPTYVGGTTMSESSGQSRGGTVLRELVDIGWVANRLGVSVRHVRRLVQEGRIPFIKWGHLLRFDPVDIEEWIAGNRRPSSE